jgi:hypothetical protein
VPFIVLYSNRSASDERGGDESRGHRFNPHISFCHSDTGAKRARRNLLCAGGKIQQVPRRCAPRNDNVRGLETGDYFSAGLKSSDAEFMQ